MTDLNEQTLEDALVGMEYITAVERVVGERKTIGCPRNCDDGYRGMDNCNTCGCTGSGFRVRGKFYPNTEEGWKEAYGVLLKSR